jgi:uncharacterized membrane protein
VTSDLERSDRTVADSGDDAGLPGASAGPTGANDVAGSADETSGPGARGRFGGGAVLDRLASVHPAAWLAAIGAVVFTVVFGRLGVQNHRNFGTWAFDMGIYDQGFWLVSRGQSWITVRGIDFWGHHFNPIVIVFVPFYWLGAGPGFLYVAQAASLGAGAIPVYLLARDRTRNPWVGLVFAVVYLMYAPIQWIAWANFHPEALVVTPFLFAWWFGTRRRWVGCYVSVVIALSTREDVALAMIMMGVVLWWWLRRHDDERATTVLVDVETDADTEMQPSTDGVGEAGRDPAQGGAAAPDGAPSDANELGAPTSATADPPARDSRGGDPAGADPVGPASTAERRDTITVRDRRMALLVSALGIVWYVVSTRLIIPAFNRGLEPFYIEYFYGHYGSNTREIVETIMTRPDRVVSDATQPDRIRFYRDLLLPWGGLPLGGLAELAMAGPQMLASVIGTSPYARTIRYQYTSVMIAPITIAAIEATAWMWRYRLVRRYLVPWLVVFAYVTNIAWSPSPISANDGVWAQPSPRHAAMNEAVDMVPSDASVSSTYSLLPHLSQREQIYNWPNPWVPSYWSNDDTYRLPDPSAIEYLVVDRLQVGGEQAELLESLIGPDGDYEVIYDTDDVIVARRR